MRGQSHQRTDSRITLRFIRATVRGGIHSAFNPNCRISAPQRSVSFFM